MPILTFKVTAAEARAIRAKARAAQAASVSAFLRKSVLGEAPSTLRPLLKTHPVSGLVYDATSGPAVTDEEIRAALAGEHGLKLATFDTGIPGAENIG
ncbi:MAG: hypothetical protein WD941_05345 [Opitutus sp.]